MAVEEETDKFCEVAEENDTSHDIANPPFPVVLCHSPDDEIIPYTQHPDVSASENLTDFKLLGITASGSHGEAGLYVEVACASFRFTLPVSYVCLHSYRFCFFSMVLPFTVFNTGPSATEQVPLDTCASAPTEASSPGTPTEAPPPTEAPLTTPTTSAGYRECLSYFTLSLVSFLWLKSFHNYSD